jgi:hypothetical protein
MTLGEEKSLILLRSIKNLQKLLTDWLPLCSWVPFERPQVVQPLGRFPAYYETRRFITTFPRALRLYLSWARWMQSTSSQPISSKSILMLSTQLRIALPCDSFQQVFLPITYTRSSYINMKINSMELSTTRDATSCVPTRYLPSILWNPKVHYHTHKSSPSVPILSQTESTTPNPISKRFILMLSIHLRLGLPSDFFQQIFLPMTYKHSSYRNMEINPMELSTTRETTSCVATR